jgi:ABC-type nitrate/sulfonate/bicarbonate transport system ATPase subunit/ABC-type proline/glycine betaine transport system permease subunit
MSRLELRGVGVDLGGRTVLDGIDLAVAPHELVAVIGPSGCGKTTLLGVVAGFIHPERGVVTVDGHPISRPGPDRAMVFQDDAVFGWMRVRGNVEYGLKVRKVPGPRRAAMTDRALDMVGLRPSERLWPRQLSGGMRKRVDIARALAADPPVLLMDEPYGALDMMTKQRLQAEFAAIFEQSAMTVLFVTHDLEEAVYLADRVIVLAPHPGSVAGELRISLPRPRPPELKLTPEFQDLRRRLAMTLSGYGLGLLLGVGMGLAFASSRAVRDLFGGTLNFIRPAPVFALIPLFLLWFGIGRGPQVALIALGTSVALSVATLDAVRNVNPTHIRAAATLGATKAVIYRTVVLPSIFSHLLGAVRFSLVAAWGLDVAAELIGSQNGLGYLMMVREQYIDTAGILTVVFLYGILAGVFDRLVVLVERPLTRWTTRGNDADATEAALGGG